MRRWLTTAAPAFTVAWAVCIALLTLLPAEHLPPTPAWRLLSFDTAAHAGVFAALAWLLRVWWHRPGRTGAALAGTFAVALGYGALIEWLQLLLALGRHAEWTDLLSDGLGAAVGVALAGWWPLRS